MPRSRRRDFGRRGKEVSRIAQLRRAREIERFTEIQRNKRQWIQFAEIAEWCSTFCDTVPPDEYQRECALEVLKQALLAGDFEENGRSKVRIYQPWTKGERLHKRWLRQLMRKHEAGYIRSAYLAYCWVPRHLFDRWLVKNHYPTSPSRFAPKHIADEVNEIERKMIDLLAQGLRHNLNLTREQALGYLEARGHHPGKRQFQQRLWPEARKAVGLSATAPPGKKKKT